jgi:hypothetical protein
MKQKLLLSRAKLLSVLILSMLLSAIASAQKNVSGKVTGGADNQPVPGATVVVKGTKVGTTTGADGAFTISVSSGSKRQELYSFFF